MKIKLLFVFFLAAFTLSAQTAAEMDLLLETNELTTAKAARFVLGALEMLPEALAGNAAEMEAYSLAQSNGWVKSSADSSITLRELSFLMVKAFDIKGGLMYSLAKNPRYAYRELKYQKIIQGRSDPAMKVSGRRFLQILDRALVYAGISEGPDAAIQTGGGVN